MCWSPTSGAVSAARTRSHPRHRGVILLCLVLSACGSGPPTVTPISQSGDTTPRLVGYFAAWSPGRKYQVSDIPADSLTHVIYAFAGISETGDCVAAYPKHDPVNLPALAVLKQQHPRLRTLISVGGANGSDRFASASASAGARQQLAGLCLAFMKQYGFDGIDVDWEFPAGTQERDDHAALLQEFRHRLDDLGRADGRSYLLTIAAPAGPKQIANLDLRRIPSFVDWINLMAYNFATSSTAITNFNAPLYAAADDPSSATRRRTYNVDAAVQTYLAAGVPASKIVVGVAFSGHGWGGVPETHHGLFQPHTAIPPGTWEPGGVFDYRDLAQIYLGRVTRYWHAEARVPWLYSPSDQVMITYDDPESLGLKADYVRAKGLGGVMVWQLSADDPAHSLLRAVQGHLGP